jgi:hypothetical protein
MPRYHFHFASRGGEHVPDPEGVELDDLRAAHRHAVKLIRRTALFTSRRWNAREWSVQVVDLERRRSVLTVLFPVAEHNGRRRAEPPMQSFDAADQLSGLKGNLDRQLASIAALDFTRG